jgi:hypothetical protein
VKIGRMRCRSSPMPPPPSGHLPRFFSQAMGVSPAAARLGTALCAEHGHHAPPCARRPRRKQPVQGSCIRAVRRPLRVQEWRLRDKLFVYKAMPSAPPAGGPTN